MTKEEMSCLNTPKSGIWNRKLVQWRLVRGQVSVEAHWSKPFGMKKPRTKRFSETRIEISTCEAIVNGQNTGCAFSPDLSDLNAVLRSCYLCRGVAVKWQDQRRRISFPSYKHRTYLSACSCLSEAEKKRLRSEVLRGRSYRASRKSKKHFRALTSVRFTVEICNCYLLPRTQDQLCLMLILSIFHFPLRHFWTPAL